MTTQGGIVEFVLPGAVATFTAGAAITGGQLVYLSGNRTVSPTNAAAMAHGVVGVALFNAATNDAMLSVAGQGVWPLTANGAVAAGDNLGSGAVNGTVATIADAGAATAADVNKCRAIVGQAWEAIADTATGRCALWL